jgi:hypothetical protein
LARPCLAGRCRGRLCTLDHSGAEAEVRLTYDPSLPEYTIAIRVAEPWPEAAVFAMRFDGPQGNMISTGRHSLSGDGLTLSVSDRGFGNVLDGLEFNEVAWRPPGDGSSDRPGGRRARSGGVPRLHHRAIA